MKKLIHTIELIDKDGKVICSSILPYDTDKIEDKLSLNRFKKLTLKSGELSEEYSKLVVGFRVK